MPPKVLLVATVSWPTAARLAGGFARAGCQVAGLVPRGDLFALSRYAERAYRYAPLRQHRSLLEAITKAQPDVIVPCDDRAVRLMIAAWREARATGNAPLVALITRSLGNPAAYDELMSRQDFIGAAKAEGLHAPEMQLIT